MKDLLNLFDNAYKAQPQLIQAFKNIVHHQPESFFGKSSAHGHITGSALVLDETRSEVLLTHHKKFNKWIQLGGHWDSLEESLLEAAMREVKEEGYGNKDIPINILLQGNIIDLDIHDVGSHLHYDACFLVEVSKKNPVVVSSESHDIAWKNINELLAHKELHDSRLMRIIEKTLDIKYSSNKKMKF